MPAAVPRREHQGAAAPATLVSSILSTDVTFNISAFSGWPTGAVGPFFVTIGGGTSSEEKILCSSRSSGTVSVAASGRGVDGTTAVAHASGQAVYPSWTAVEADEANAHMAASSAVHGAAGTVVGTTDSQVLTNKTMSGASNTFSAIALGSLTGLPVGALVGTSDAQVLTNKTIDASLNTLSNIAQAAVTGLTAALTAWNPLVARKTASENRSSTTLADDSELFLDLVAGRTYRCTLRALINASSGLGGIDMTYSLTGGLVALSRRLTILAGNIGTNDTINGIQTYTGFAASAFEAFEEFEISAAGGAGRITLRWAQNNNGGTQPGPITMAINASLSALRLT